MGNMSGSSGSHYTLWQSITQNSQDIANNKSNVTVRMYLAFDGSSWYAYTNYATSGSMTINGTTHNYSIASISFSSGQAKDLLLAEWTGDIYHNADGTQTVSVSGSWDTDTSKIGSGNCSASLALSTIPRYSEINSFSIQSMGLTTAVIQYSVSRTANIYCSVDGMIWGDPRVYNTTFGTFTISGLSPNKKHSFAILVRDVESGLDRISDTMYGNTLNIGTVTSVPDINFGDTATIVKSNPSGARNDLRIETLSPSTVTIATRRQIPNNYTLTLTDDEWDALYKKLGNSNSITLRYVIDTIDGSNTYYHWVDRTLTLKGNQKTIRTNVSNSWKRGKLWTKVNGIWGKGVLWTNVSGTWKRGI